MNSSGKVLVIFLVITALLLISLTAISLFFFQKETERRKLAEVTLEEFQGEKMKIDEELKEVKKKNFLLQEKNKEAEARINNPFIKFNTSFHECDITLLDRVALKLLSQFCMRNIIFGDK